MKFRLCAVLVCWGVAGHAVGSMRYQLADQPSHLKISPRGRFIAYLSGVSSQHLGQRPLRVLDTVTGHVQEVASSGVGSGFAWSPYGKRLVVRRFVPAKTRYELVDVYQQQSVLLRELEGSGGWPVVDRQRLRLRFVIASGQVGEIHFRYPGERFGQGLSQSAQDAGSWLVTERRAMWKPAARDEVRHVWRAADRGSEIEAFDLSRNSQDLVWQDGQQRLWLSRHGEQPVMIAWGRHPSWNKDGTQIVFSGMHRVGQKAAGYDLRLFELKSRSLRWLTRSVGRDEAWPVWDSDSGCILHAVDESDQIYCHPFRPEVARREAAVPARG